MLEGDVVIDKSGSSTPFYGSRKLGYDNHAAMYGSRSSRMFNEYAVNRATMSSSMMGFIPSPWMMDFDHPPLAMESFMTGSNGRNLSYEALKAAYKDRTNTRRLSYEDIV